MAGSFIRSRRNCSTWPIRSEEVLAATIRAVALRRILTAWSLEARVLAR